LFTQVISKKAVASSTILYLLYSEKFQSHTMPSVGEETKPGTGKDRGTIIRTEIILWLNLE
jgi:hypothetical protein